MDIFSFNDQEKWLFLIFSIIVIGFLIIDLGILHKNPGKISNRSALYQTIFWIAISLAFGVGIYFYDGGSDKALEFFSAYLTEKALSVDNIFVIILILKYFNVKEEHYHRILFWGILGAIVFRGIFIFLGALLISQFHWILYIFGAFLLYSGIKMFQSDEDEKIDPENNPVIRFVRKFFRITSSDHGGKFTFTKYNKLYFTPLFLVLVLIETTDLIFAVDSIPAAFAITQDEFIVYTSNIFAVMGLRAMFFLLAGILGKFYLLQKGLSFVLIFIGAKMLLEIVNVEIPVYISFVVIILAIGSSMLFSVIWPKKQVAATADLPQIEEEKTIKEESNQGGEKSEHKEESVN